MDHETPQSKSFERSFEGLSILGVVRVVGPHEGLVGVELDFAALLRKGHVVVVVPAHGLYTALAHEVDAFARLGSVADDVARADDLVAGGGGQSPPGRYKGLVVRVNVAKYS
jgi:hypothetical protein